MVSRGGTGVASGAHDSPMTDICKLKWQPTYGDIVCQTPPRICDPPPHGQRRSPAAGHIPKFPAS
jgi:hypothetical protein